MKILTISKRLVEHCRCNYLFVSIMLLIYSFCSYVYAASDIGIQKIQHVIIVMQENRSFDHYFGTYPGAEGIPMENDIPTVCCPDPLTNKCVKPYHDSNDLNFGGPHGSKEELNVIDGGRMDGFINVLKGGEGGTKLGFDPSLVARGTKRLKKRLKQNINGIPDIMGYHDRREIPNYWKYADEFVLQDHMFEPIGSWSLPSHLYLVSAWCAKCTSEDPMSCTDAPHDYLPEKDEIYAWTDLTYLLHRKSINWAYYLDEGDPVDENDPNENIHSKHKKRVPQVWNPLPSFVTVKEDNELDHVKPLSGFFAALKSKNLPEVIWIVPNQYHSEHPVALVSNGQAFVTTIVNAIMNSPYWNSSVIFITWDDWGGFYDHVLPPKIDENGYGLRVPGLTISPYAKRGYVDHQILSFDAYLKFIEDVFLNKQRIDPKTDGRPDRRPAVREDASILGDLTQEFDFNQEPRPPLILSPRPKK